jgi:hypothetical protein
MGFGLMTRFIGLFDTACDYTLQFSVTRTRARAHTHTQSHCRCLVAAFNRGCFPSSVFPNCPWPQVPASNSNSSQWLSPVVCHPVLFITSCHELGRKRLFYYCCILLLPWIHACLQSHYLAMAAVYLLISWSLPINGSTCHNIIYS